MAAFTRSKFTPLMEVFFLHSPIFLSLARRSHHLHPLLLPRLIIKAMASAPTPDSRIFRFLDLPSEIQQKIARHHYENLRPIGKSYNNLLLVNRACYSAFAPFYYRQAEFASWRYEILFSQFLDYSTTCLHNIRRLRVVSRHGLWESAECNPDSAKKLKDHTDMFLNLLPVVITARLPSLVNLELILRLSKWEGKQEVKPNQLTWPGLAKHCDISTGQFWWEYTNRRSDRLLEHVEQKCRKCLPNFAHGTTIELKIVYDDEEDWRKYKAEKYLIRRETSNVLTKFNRAYLSSARLNMEKRC